MKKFNIKPKQINCPNLFLIGKGYMKGSQSQQSFLPEKQTDFIFTMLGEEFGFIGAFGLIGLYSMIIMVLFWCAKTCRNRFGQLICFGCLSYSLCQ